jgi:citrate synthase
VPTTALNAHSGLRDAVVGNTRLSAIDGEAGRLIYCGFDIHDLALHSTFEETVFLLWYHALPTAAHLEDLRSKLAARRHLAPALLAIVRDLPRTAVPMDVLRTIVSAAALYDPSVKDMSPDATLDKAIRLTALFPTILAAFHRLEMGREPVTPRPELGAAANFLYMMTAEEPDPFAARVLDAALVLHADHGMNASTFSAIVTAATLSDLYSAIASAIGTLKGPLHGGANEGVIENLVEIGSSENVDGWVDAKFVRHEKIMGFGHAVYKTYDPRATVLKAIAKQIGDRAGSTKWVALTEALERSVWERRGLYPNVDLYSACVYHTLGIPTRYFTPVFAMSRVAGWCAHVIEQYADNRLIRPSDNYIGSRDLEYVPIERRAADIPV